MNSVVNQSLPFSVFPAPAINSLPLTSLQHHILLKHSHHLMPSELLQTQQCNLFSTNRSLRQQVHWSCAIVVLFSPHAAAVHTFHAIHPREGRRPAPPHHRVPRLPGASGQVVQVSAGRMDFRMTVILSCSKFL